MPTADTPPPERPLARVAARGAAWLGALNGLGGVLALALYAWLNRAMENAPVQMGLWLTAATVILLATMLFELGIGTTIMQRRDLDEQLVAKLSLLVFAQGLIGSAIVWLLAEPLAALADDAPQEALARVVRSVALVVALICFAVPAKTWMQRALRFRAVATIESSATLIFCIAGALLAPRRGVEGLVIATFLRHGWEALCYWSVAGFPARALLRVRSLRGTGGAVGYALAMGGQGILGSVGRQGDALLVLGLSGSVAVGLWQQVQRFVMLPFSKLLIYAHRAAFPTFAKVQDDPERLARGLRRMQRLAVLAVLPALAGLAAVAPRLLALFLGPQYAALLDETVTVMRLLCIAGAFYAYAFSCGVVANAAGHAGTMLSRQAINVVLVFALMAVGSLAGLEGMAAGRAFASIATAALFVHVAISRLHFRWRDVAASLREAVPASLAVVAVVTLAGAAASRSWPTSAPETWLAAGGLASHGDAVASAPIVAVLAAQVALGVVVYLLALLAIGVRPVAEARELLGRRGEASPA